MKISTANYILFNSSQRLHHHEWGDEVVVYEEKTGNTFLLDLFSFSMLEHIASVNAVSKPVLADHLKQVVDMDSHEVLEEQLDSRLSWLQDLKLITLQDKPKQ